MKRTILIIGGIIVLAALGYIIVRNAPEGGVQPVPGGQSSQATSTVIAYDQRPGGRITIALAVLDQPGFVVIHADANGAPGTAIASSALLGPGEHTNVEVQLGAATEEGEIFHAMLHKDNGNGTFDASTDQPLLGPLGGLITSRFEISPDAIAP